MGVLQDVHDASLVAWCATTAVRAIVAGRPGRVEAALIATNLVSGAPPAWRRARSGRYPVPLLLAPPAVLGVALTGTAQGRAGSGPLVRWVPVAATAALVAVALRVRGQRRMGRPVPGIRPTWDSR